MRDPRRDRGRKTYLVIDEFGLAAQVEAVGQLAATMCKVARKFGYAMVVVDQNPTTFLHAQSGREILENTGACSMPAAPSARALLEGEEAANVPVER